MCCRYNILVLLLAERLTVWLNLLTMFLSLVILSSEICVVLNLIIFHIVTSVGISLSLRYISFSLSNSTQSLYKTWWERTENVRIFYDKCIIWLDVCLCVVSCDLLWSFLKMRRLHCSHPLYPYIFILQTVCGLHQSLKEKELT